MQKIKLKEYLLSDYFRLTGKQGCFLRMFIKSITTHEKSYRYMFWLRLAQHRNVLQPAAILMHRRLSSKYNVDISRKTKIGLGLTLGHGICIVVSRTAVIGNNVNISQFVNIGSNHGASAVIGDNVYIGPHVCLVENVHIGNNVTIGAGAVVTKDIPENATAVGVPAKVIHFNNPGLFIGKRYEVSGDS